MFEWDETKRLKTLAARELDFLDATALFDGRPSIVLNAEKNGEARFLTVGQLEDGKCYTVFWTRRGGVVRIISFRRSRDGEKRTYHARHG